MIAEDKPVPILMGRHLIELGMSPGKHFKEILDRAYEMQLDGEFNSLDEAVLLITGSMTRMKKPE